MNTIEQPQAPGRGSRRSMGGEPGARADTADVVLLLLTILTLMGVATGIAIGFPLALEAVAAQASATTVNFPAPQARHVQREEDLEEGEEPVIVDDIRTAGVMYAAAGIAGLIDRSAPEASGKNR